MYLINSPFKFLKTCYDGNFGKYIKKNRIKNPIYVNQFQQLATHFPEVLSDYLVRFFFLVWIILTLFLNVISPMFNVDFFYRTTVPLSHLTKLTIILNIL